MREIKRADSLLLLECTAIEKKGAFNVCRGRTAALRLDAAVRIFV